MNQVFKIVALELKRMRRNQFSWLLVLLTLFVVFLMDLFNYFTIEEQVKMIQDFSLGILNLSLLFIAVYYPILQLKDEISAKTIYPLLSAPLNRWQIMFGKYLAVAVILLITLFINYFSLIIMIFIKDRSFPPELYKAFVLLFMKHMLVAAYSYIFAVLPLSSMIATICSFFIYFAASVKAYFSFTLEKSASTSAVYIQKIFFSVIPDFRIFDVVEKITLEKHIPYEHIFYCFLHFTGVTILALMAGIFFFNKKEI